MLLIKLGLSSVLQFRGILLFIDALLMPFKSVVWLSFGLNLCRFCKLHYSSHRSASSRLWQFAL